MKKSILNEINEMKYMFGYKRGVVISEQETKGMSFLGSTPGVQNDWDAGNGFFGIAYDGVGIIGGVMNSWNGGSGESKKGSFNTSEQLAIPGNGGSLESAISFNYVTTIKAGDSLSLTFNATSNTGNASSETYSYRSPVSKDTIYKGRFTLMNLPQNSTITITANGDSENKLVVTTLTPVNCETEWKTIEKALEEALNKNQSIDIKPYICKKDQTEFIKENIPGIEQRKVNCLLGKVSGWCQN